jgi:2'-5' RNA ligase
MRTFLAILLSEKTRALLAECSEELKATGADVKWVEEENFHITLCFFGDISPDTCDSIINKMPQMTSGLKPFPVSFYGMGAFPNLRKPKVIWAGVKKGKREIIEVHRKILPVIQSLGFEEKKKYTPHVTMGRVRSPANLESMISLIEKCQFIGEDWIQGISLMESVLTPKGAKYSEMAFSKFK